MVARDGNRPGKSRLGCLFVLLVLAVAIYQGVGAFQVYFRYYRLQDTVNGLAELAPAVSDDVIRDRLVAYADTLGVPLGPRAWRIQRSSSPRQITIDAQYRDSVVIRLPFFRKVFSVEFKPSAKAPL